MANYFTAETADKKEEKKKPDFTAALLNAPSKEKVIGFTSTAIEIIVILFIVGLASLIQVQFQINTVDWAIFVFSLVLRLAIIFMSKDVGARLRVEIGQSDPERLRLLDILDKAKEGIQFAPFGGFIEKENIRLKREAYKTKIYRKIYRRERKNFRLKSRIKAREFATETKLFKWLPFLKWFVSRGNALRKWIMQKHQDKIDEYMPLVDEEYIDSRIEYIHVRYTKISVADFEISELSDKVSAAIYHINKERENKKQIIKGLPFPVVMSFALAWVGLYSITFGTLNLLTLALDIFSVTFNFGNGWFIVGKNTLTIEKVAATNKIRVLEGYKAAQMP